MLKNKKVIIFDMDGTIQEQRDHALRMFNTAPSPYIQYCKLLGD